MLNTILHDLHLKLNAKMAEFAGYDMPINYEKGIIFEHNWTRENAGLFDVSHMGQAIVNGSDAFMKIAPLDLKNLKLGRQCYGYFTTDKGTITDDFMIAKIAEERFFLVVNAGCKDKDFAYMKKSGVDFEVINNRGLLALQGPKAREVMARNFKIASDMKFMDFKEVEILGKKSTISCSGYTGEDGFEFSVDFSDIHKVVEILLNDKDVEIIGLGARDTLRLEAGLCLYGHELTTETTPVEAGINWAIPKALREKGDYLGNEVIINQIKNGTKKRLVGFLPSIPAREGTEIYSIENNLIGRITSGGFSPSLGKPIACGYIDTGYTGEKVLLKVRNKMVEAEITSLPFVKHNYFRG